MKVLVAYATSEGQTAAIAGRIGAVLAEAGHVASLADLADGSMYLGPYDAVIAGGSIHTGRFSKQLHRFISENADALSTKRSAFFSVSLAEADRSGKGHAQVQPVIDHFLAEHGWTPAAVQSFAGALKYSKYNPLVRFVMKRISKGYGGDTDTHRDYEYTDWAAVDRFAIQVAALHAPAGAAVPV